VRARGSPADPDTSFGGSRPSVAAQAAAGESRFRQRAAAEWDFNFTTDRLVRFLRDRRLDVALTLLTQHGTLGTRNTVLVVCGGVGGEGVYLLRHGFADVTVSDIAPTALEIARSASPR
jgi:16S rRNA G1207 methylase RsmC